MIKITWASKDGSLQPQGAIGALVKKVFWGDCGRGWEGEFDPPNVAKLFLVAKVGKC